MAAKATVKTARRSNTVVLGLESEQVLGEYVA
jgi:hypothetical protein